MSSKEKVRPPRSLLLRLGVAVSLLLVGLVVAFTVVARVAFHGDRLASTVASILNDRIRGSVKVGSIEWPLSRLHTVAVGGWLPLTIHDIEVYDEGGKRILTTSKATGEIDTHAAIFDRRLVFRNLAVPDGGSALIELVTEPEPLHEYDRTVVSLVLAFRAKAPPAFSAGYSAGRMPVFDLQDYEVTNADVEFAILPHFHARTYGVSGKGFLRVDGSDALTPRFYFSLRPRAERASVIVPTPIDLVDVQVERFAQVPLSWPRDNLAHDLEYRATARTTDGADVRIAGKLSDFWLDHFGGEHDVALEVDRAGAIAGTWSGGVAGGDRLGVRVEVEGPTIVPRVRVALEELALAVPIGRDTPPLDLAVARSVAEFDRATDSGHLSETVARGAGGELRFAARFDLDPTTLEIDLQIPEAIELAPYLPPEVARTAGTRLSGSLRAFGSPRGQRLDDLDLTLGEAKISGSLSRTDDGLIEAHDLTATLGGTTVSRFTGKVDLERRWLDVDFSVLSSDLSRWLRRFGAPPMATRVAGTSSVSGSFDDPRSRGRLVFGGVPVVSRVEADYSYTGNTVTVREAQSSVLGGWLRGSGKVILNGRNPTLADVEAQGVNLNLANLPWLGPALEGRADVKLEADGPLRSPRSRVEATLADWSLAGDRYQDTRIAAHTEPDGSGGLAFHLERLRGGRLDVAAEVAPGGGLGGALSLREVPIESVLATAGQDAGMAGGTLDAELLLGGTARRPTVEGAVNILRSWFRDAFLGSATLTLEPTDGARVRVSGTMFQGKVRVDGTIGTLPPFDADLELSLRRIELDLFAREPSQRFGARSWVSGDVRWRGSLLPVPGQAPEIHARLTEAVLLVDNEDRSGRPAPIRLHNRSPVTLAFDGDTLEILEPVTVSGPAGDFQLSGRGSAGALDFRFEGRIAVALLEPYMRELFDTASGTLDLRMRLVGNLDAPRLTGVLEVEDVEVKPRGQDATVAVPSGKIEFANDQLAVTGLRVLVIDEFSEESAELRVAGGVRLQNFVPELWAIRIEGQLAGKMLLVALPAELSSASGSADISIALEGIGRAPGIDGTIEFRAEDALKLTPRGLRREIALTSGSLEFDDQLVTLRDVGGWIDDEGELLAVNGEVSLADWVPESIDLTVTARDLPFRIPRELDLSINVDQLSIVGGFDDGIEIEGTAEIVDGRYSRAWQPFLEALRPQRIAEREPPPWAAIPLLADARLNLTLRTRAFFVKNNMADIELGGAVTITGTPRAPRFDGVVRVDQGDFKFQGIRARFSRTSGSVTFSRHQRFPEDTPTLRIQSESDYRDISGKDHLVTLTLEGPISRLNWDLTTNAGLSRAQALSLIMTGRTTDEARQTLGDQPIGRRPGEVGTRSTAGDDSSLLVVDQVAKDLFGDFFALLIEDPIRNVTTLDVARLELGTTSIGVRVEKNFTRSLRFIGEGDLSSRGWSWDARGEYRLTDTWSADGEILRKVYEDEAQRDETIRRLRVTWRRILLP